MVTGPQRAPKPQRQPKLMTDKSKRPIIVIKKKAAHAGHHGGAWKVAYADFVTAMMALFIVLWLTSSGEKVRKSIAGYFNDPNGTGKELGTDRNGGEGTPLDKENISHLKDQLQKEIAKRPDLKPMADQIQIAITPEGMRIELLESKDGTFFESGSAVLNNTGKELLALLAKELGGVPNHISTEGHTDSQPYADATKHDNWDLSTERANSARRLMQATGLHLGQISQISQVRRSEPAAAVEAFRSIEPAYQRDRALHRSDSIGRTWPEASFDGPGHSEGG